jgi:hypothetical protein
MARALTTDKEIAEALEAESPRHALHQLATRRAEAGATRDEQYEAFTAAMLETREAGDEIAEDAILDTLDAISGFCNRIWRIYERN